MSQGTELAIAHASCQAKLDAIASALKSHAAIAECAVIERAASNGSLELVAYIVPDAPLVPTQILAYLQSLLPEQHLPSIYVPVSTIPLTAAGSLDETALAAVNINDAALAERWQEWLQQQPEIEQVKVALREQLTDAKPLHLLDLLLDMQGENLPRLATNQSQLDRSATSSNKMAIACGGELHLSDDAPASLGEILAAAAIKSPDKGIYYIQADNSRGYQSYPDLLAAAESVLAGLRKLGLKPEDKVIFQFASNQDFISAFWGCLLGGFVPVPLALESFSQPGKRSQNSKLYLVWQMLGQPLILTSQALISSRENLAGAEMQLVAIEGLLANDRDRYWHCHQPEDLALLMLTSGSTGTPKGVMLSARNLICHAAATAQINGDTSQEVSLNWLPLDHVGGILMFHLRSVFLGCQQIHAATEIVLQNPLKWLDWMEQYRATITWAPNFLFGLITNQAETLNQRQWDLSSMRSIVNAAENIAVKTARNFLQLLQPHSLPASAMRPAWGMSETCSGASFASNFTLDTSTDTDIFVSLGAPIPGVSMRIVDEDSQLLPEKAIGRLQVKGLTVTSGYYQNPEVNRQAFTEDGWFDTGDLGFIENGQLTLTGRQKEIIIINGINYYSHEIESKIEEISGIKVSFTAACAAVSPSSNSECLAVFFVPLVQEENQLKALLAEIRGVLVRDLGVNPEYLLPVAESDIPKTEIGKIQRSRLQKKLAAGEFAEAIKRADLLSDRRTIPDWFYQKIWRPKQIFPAKLAAAGTGATLILADSQGLSDAIAPSIDSPCITVIPGDNFAQINSRKYQINCRQPDSYRQLLETVQAEFGRIERVLHLWNYDPSHPISSLSELETALAINFSLLWLVQALEQVRQDNRTVQLYAISNHQVQIAWEKSPMVGLMKAIPRELPWLQSYYLELPLSADSINYLLAEMQANSKDREVAYRQGQRLVSRYVKVNWQQNIKHPLPFKVNGTYLISGGLGGIGREIAKYLLQEWGAKVLLLGRTVLPEKSQWQQPQPAEIADKIAAYESLAAAIASRPGGEIAYAAVDITNLEQLQAAVGERQIDGIIHLAGVVPEQLLTQAFASNLQNLMLGTWALHQLIKQQPSAIFISFARASGYLGGAMQGLLGAAASFLESFCHYQRENGFSHSYCLAWSLWEEIGSSRDYPWRQMAIAQGYQTISAKQGKNSLLAVLHRQLESTIIGLDSSKLNVRRQLESPPETIQKLQANIIPRSNTIPLEQWQQTINILDRFGQSSQCELRLALPQSPPQLPVTAAGASPVKLTEAIASIWQEVLPVDKVGWDDSFFDLGGHSLLLAQVQAKLQAILQRDISLLEMFSYPTVNSLAQYLNQVYLKVPAFVASQNRALWRQESTRKQRERRRKGLKLGQ